MIDSRKVSRVSQEAVIEGSQLLFYIGEWTSDGERVRSLFDVRSETDLGQTTLGRLRDQSPDYQKASATVTLRLYCHLVDLPQRFKEWIESSLVLHHRNILNFAGHVTINNVVYSVCPASSAVAMLLTGSPL